jgi:hypothetical protein
MRCVCDCGEETIARLTSLRSGNTQSCGCWGRERRIASTTTHGLTQHALYQTWWAVVRRCEDPDCVEYEYYGGRGISLYGPWHDVTVFIQWIEANLGPRPEGMTLDRIDNDGNYEPGNVRWADRLTQRHNGRQPISAGGRFWPHDWVPPMR